MDTSMSSYGSKSRREMFEEQLKDLQRDISSLSHKLSTPSLVTTNRMNALKSSSSNVDVIANSSSAPNTNMSTMLKSSNTDNSLHQQSGLKASFEMPKSHDLSYLTNASHNSTQNILNMSSSTQLSSQDIKFQQSRFDLLATELKEALKQRDDAQRHLEQLKSENEELKRNLVDYTQLKTAFENLKHDHESLKMSFQSCERIRIQQKELIDVLQKSQVLMGGDNGSVMSFNSVSSISHTAAGSTAMAAASQFTNQSSILPVGGSFRSVDDNASQGSSVLPTVLSNINASMSHRTGTIPSANSSVRSAKPHKGKGMVDLKEHQDWLNASVPAVVNVPRVRTPKGRSRSVGRPPRSSVSAPSSQLSGTATPVGKRRSVTPTPSSQGKQIIPKNHIVGAVPQYLVSPMQVNASHISEASSTDPFLSVQNQSHSLLSNLSTADHSSYMMNTSPYHMTSQPTSSQYYQQQPVMQNFHAAPSSSTLKDPQQTSTMLTSLLLNQSPVRVTKVPAVGGSTQKKSSKKKMTRRSTTPTSSSGLAPSSLHSNNHHNTMVSRHTTHITPSTHTSSMSATKKKITGSSSHKPSKEPLVDEKTGVRILYRAVPSPSASFSRARRL